MGRRGIIIGGGAAGMTAAVAAARRGAEVTILEHMPRVGKKILSTGNGKCNLTNLRMEASCFHCGQSEFPMEVISRFSVEKTLSFFRGLGIRTVDRRGYVYPASEQASAVLDALMGAVLELGVKVACGSKIRMIENRDGQFFVDTEDGCLTADFVILAAGSAAAPATGSNGSGYVIAQSLGHHIIKPLPALVQLRCEGAYFKALAGVRTQAEITVWADGERLASDCGELQLTDYGISGIPVFQISRFASEALEKKKKVSVTANFYPEGSGSRLMTELREQKFFLSNRKASCFLDGFFNKKLAAVLLKESGIRPEAAVSEITDRRLLNLSQKIREFEFRVSATNPFTQAQTCMGGVDAVEIDSRTMESKLMRGLYFAGEIVDVDGICGGYNLQWAWSSGHLAGSSAAEATQERGSTYDSD